jgi:hypothetical protein
MNSDIDQISLGQVILTVLATPWNFRSETQSQAPISRLYLIALLTLLMWGLLSAPAVTMRPLMVCFIALGLWGVLVSTLHIACSLLDIPVIWKECSRLLSLAGLPILLKFLGAAIFSMTTSISPFLFTAGPALIVKEAPSWLWRIDYFEIWSAALLYLLLTKRGLTPRQALRITGIVWIAAFVLLTCLWHFGENV